MCAAPAPSAGPAEHIRRAMTAQTRESGVPDGQQPVCPCGRTICSCGAEKPVCAAAKKKEQLTGSNKSPKKRAAEPDEVKKQARSATSCKRAANAADRKRAWCKRTWRLTLGGARRKFHLIKKTKQTDSGTQHGHDEWTVKVVPYKRGFYKLWILGEQSVGILLDLRMVLP